MATGDPPPPPNGPPPEGNQPPLPPPYQPYPPPPGGGPPGWNPQPPGGGRPPAWRPSPPPGGPGGWMPQPPGTGGQPGWGAPPPGWGPPPPGAPSPPGWPPPPAGYPPYAAAGAYWNPGIPQATGGLRARGVGELLDGAFTLYRRNFVLLVAIAAVVQVPFAFLSLLAYGLAGVGGRLADIQSITRSVEGPGTTLTPDQSSLLYSDLGALVAYFAALFILQFLIVFPLSQAATTSAVSARYLDQPTSVGASYSAALSRWRALIAMVMWLTLLVALPLAGAVLLSIAAGSAGLLVLFVLAFFVFYLVVLIRSTVAPAVIVLEKLKGWPGIRRSFHLTAGSFWRIFGIRLLLLLIQLIAGGALTLPVNALTSGASLGTQEAISQVTQAIVAVFIAPITLVTLTLLYYDLRIRREGFDIEMLAASL